MIDQIGHSLFVNPHRRESVPLVDPTLVETRQVDVRVIPRFAASRRESAKRGRREEFHMTPGIEFGGFDQILIRMRPAPFLLLACGCDHAAELERRLAEADGRLALRQKSVAELHKKFIV